MYEWQGRPPHERPPGHLARLDSLYVVISPLACYCFYVDVDDDDE